MFRRARVGVALAVLLALVAPLGADAALPEGPRISFGVWDLREEAGDVSLQTVAADGSARTILVRDGKIRLTPFDGGSWSPDGSELAFAGWRRIPKNQMGKTKEPGRIYLVAADGSGVRALPGTRGARDPVFSADGRTIAFSRIRLRLKVDLKPPFDFEDDGFSGTTTWIYDLATGKSRQLTRWRDGLFAEPTGFSPDGRTLLIERERGRGGETVKVDLATGQREVFARQAKDAVYSPDGTRVALISYRDRQIADTGDGLVLVGELYVVEADGSGWRRLSRTREAEEGTPSWDPSGQRIAFTRTTGDEFLAFGSTNVLIQVNADGTCPTRLVGKPREGFPAGPGLYAPTWRPGPGREAGPIVC